MDHGDLMRNNIYIHSDYNRREKNREGEWLDPLGTHVVSDVEWV